jgi:AraC-like DNA-binding protein
MDNLAGVLLPLMEGLLREAALDTIDANRAAEHYAELISINLRREVQMIDDPRQRRLEEQLRRLSMEVDANLALAWTNAELARRMHMSVGHFHRIIQQYFQMTPMQMVLRLRMQRAEAMLKYTDEPLAAIGARVGYENPFAFSVAFKRWATLSPKDFRKRERIMGS